ncbi:MFS transporter [Sediminibacillus sp. JSM 1682029]|uniref:MFS transporter n=1 Tax=Sediminibacillus sp. JSM 1682029 TaxID=3229857 RepID=UPI0035237233
MNRWELFQQKSFVVYWLGYLFSAMGDSVFILVVSWFIVQLTGSGVMMGTFLLFVGIPRVVMMVLGGSVVDRFSPRMVMLFSDIMRAVILLIVAILYMTGSLHMPVLLGFGVIFGVVDAFYWPSVTAIRQRIVVESQYPQSNSVLTGTWQISAIVGPVLGGALISLLGFGWCFGVTGMLFFISAITLFFIKLLPKQSVPDTAKESKKLLSGMFDGIKFIRQSPLLLVIITTALFGNAAMSTITVGLPFLAEDYQVGAEGLGYMSASLGIGGILMSVLLSVVIIIKKASPRIMMAVLFFQGMTILFIGFTQNHWQVAFLIGLIGACGAVLGIFEQSISQSIIPPHLMGRVYSIILVVAQGVTPLAQALSGWLLDVLDVHTIFVIGGPTQMIAAGIAFFLPAVIYHKEKEKPLGKASTS